MAKTEYKIDLTTVMGYPIAVEFTPWQEGVSWVQHSDKGSLKSQYYEESGFPLSFLIHQPQTQAWCETIPLDIKNAIIQFEIQFKNHAFAALWFASRSEGASQLLLSSPILMWLVLRHSIQNELPMEDVNALFYAKRVEILKLFGLPATKAVLRFFNRYALQDFDQFELATLKSFLAVHQITYINRLNFLNLPLIRWLTAEPQWIHAGFVKNMEATTQIYTVKTYLDDTLRMGFQLRDANVEQGLQNCSTILRLIAIHDAYIERINQTTFYKYENVKYIASNLECSETIIPILSYKDLFSEGRDMKHCVVSYHDRLMTGHYFVFKLLAPERATVGIIKRNGRFSVEQIRLKCNKAPSEATKEAVYWWLQNAK